MMTGSLEDRRNWFSLLEKWKSIQADPQDYNVRRVFHDSIRYEAKGIPGGFHEGFEYSSMPYMFWNHILSECRNENIKKTILVNIPEEYVQEHFFYLKKASKNGLSNVLRGHLEYISLRDDKYGGVPVVWLETIYM